MTFNCKMIHALLAIVFLGSLNFLFGATSVMKIFMATAAPVPAIIRHDTASVPPASAIFLAGINIAGFEFGCVKNGTCPTASVTPPLAKYKGKDGIGQMQHFVNDDGFNAFRIPVSWQFLTNSTMSSTLNPFNFGKYNELVQACLLTDSWCIIDLHQYGRFNGAIIGQGGPSNENFASLWFSIATRYRSDNRVIFGIMNEPHDMPSSLEWALTVQAAVLAIRGTGASQIILLPGDNYSSASFISSGSGEALATVTNPDGSVTNLVFEVHKYLDSDSSGRHSECIPGSLGTWSAVAKWLRQRNRQALVTETGGGNTSSCLDYVCEQVAYFEANSDVFLGYVSWAAGSFSTSYTLSETPTLSDGTWTDTPLIETCLAPNRFKAPVL